VTPMTPPGRVQQLGLLLVVTLVAAYVVWRTW